MTDRRRTVLLALLAATGLATAFLLSRVLATVFFGITLATVMVPFYRWLRRRGLPPYWASAASTVVVFAAALLLFLPIAVVLYVRRVQLLGVLRSLPDEFVVDLLEFTYVIDTGEATNWLASYLGRVAVGLAGSTPAMAAHATVLAFVVFGLLAGRSRLHRALTLPVPDGYRDVLQTLYVRARGTLFALYVIQAATALGTFAIAFVVFWALGYPFPVTLAVLAGILQFLPVIGPSVLVVGVAAYEASVGAYPRAALVLVLGLLLVGILPDAVLRPRLARQTAGLPSSLYFVGFTGGLLSVGPVGIIAGPLAVALLTECLAILARDGRSDASALPTDHPAADPPPSDRTPTERGPGPDDGGPLPGDEPLLSGDEG